MVHNLAADDAQNDAVDKTWGSRAQGSGVTHGD
jgi:hypothetical protein